MTKLLQSCLGQVKGCVTESSNVAFFSIFSTNRHITREPKELRAAEKHIR